LGTALLSGNEAAFTTSSLAAGSHTITVVYSGDAKDAASTSPELTQAVERHVTTTSIKSAPNPAAPGQAVIFTVTVTVTPLNGATPIGSATFYADGTALGTATLDASGTTSFSTSSLGPGKHEIKAIYGGSLAFEASTSAALTQSIQ
jgi:hypothetical protein